MARTAFFNDYHGYYYSNFAATIFFWRDRLWMTAEHAYQASKFEDPTIQEAIWKARSPYEAKAIAHSMRRKKRPDWGTEVKLVEMEGILRAKLEQHPWIQSRLLASEDDELVEDSTHEFWGRGGKSRPGENHLGRLWMKLRAELQATV